MAADITQASDARRTLVLASVAHELHNGFVDTLYLLLPVWQAECSLDYAALNRLTTR
jgi:hypothetical protein